MKIKLFLIILLFLIISGCSDIDYPPRGATIVDMANGEDASADSGNQSSSDKYKLKKFDLTEKTFDKEIIVEADLVADPAKIDYITIDIEFNAPQHYSVGIVAVSTEEQGESSVVSLTAKGENIDTEELGVFYIGGEIIDNDDDAHALYEYILTPIYFPEGAAQLTFTALRGNIRIDTVKVVNTSAIDPERFQSTKSLSIPAPSAETIAVYEYLSTQFGSRALTAQHCTVNTNVEIEAVYAATGREPAVRFGDLSGIFTETQEAFSIEIELAKEWSDKGGIVAFTWMWNSPDGSEGYYSADTAFSLSEVVENTDNSGVAQMDMDSITKMAETGEINTLCMQAIRDIDEVSVALAQLSESGVPVLFNPLPDGGSRLYWWGGNGEDYVRLWRLMYERMIDYHGLDNIIWVWSGGNHKYYPGDNRVDIIGESAFVGGDVGSQSVKLGYSADYSNDSALKKPTIITASSGVPSADVLARDNAGWLIWTLYKGDFVIDNKGVVLKKIKERLDRFYNHELTVCLDSLPKFS